MDNSNTSLKMLPADTFCLAILPATDEGEGFCCLITVLLLSVFSKYSVMNFSKAAISSSAVLLISVTATPEELDMLTSEMLLELLDFLELAVDWLPCEESVLLEPSERELAWQVTKINEHMLFEEEWRVKLGSFLFRKSLIGRLCVTRSLCNNTFTVFNLKSCRRQCG